MKHLIMLFALLLTLGLLAACGKDDHPNEHSKQVSSPRPDSVTHYEGNWVMDGQVIDKTEFIITFYRYDGTILSINHMPYEVLLQNVFSGEQLKQLIVENANTTLEQLGYTNSSSSVSLIYKSGWMKYNIHIGSGSESWGINVDCQIDGLYEQDHDQWTLKWTVNGLNIYKYYSTPQETKGYTFDPALTLILVSTKRLN